MIKIMLVEDDKSLREIYGVRLLAEGYDIVSASDGEQALAVAIKERPALIVTDLMMPKIGGFDMLDILRSTTETKDIKVIVMTALGSEEQRRRGESLGADRYLVKSQVGIEDVVRAVHEVLGDTPAATPIATPVSQPVNPALATTRAATPPSAPVPPRPVQQVDNAQTAPVPAIAPPLPTVPVAPSVKNRVIQPINDPSTSRVNINELLDRELAREAGIEAAARPNVASTAQEKALVQDQLNQFSATPPPAPANTSPTPVTPNPPTIQIGSDGQVTAPPPSAPAMPTPTVTAPPPSVTNPLSSPPVAPTPAPSFAPPPQAPQNTTPAGPPPPPPPVQ